MADALRAHAFRGMRTRYWLDASPCGEVMDAARNSPCKAPGALTVVMLALALLSMAAENDNTVLRRRVPLRDGWSVRQLDTDKPDVAALAREAISPDKSWMPARMPAQIHELLLARGLIPDPHIGTNAAACAITPRSCFGAAAMSNIFGLQRQMSRSPNARFSSG